MTRRSLRVWMFAFALLASLAVAAAASAKPPDLPIDPNDTIPILTPPPFDSMPPGEEVTPPMPEPLPGWPTITVDSAPNGTIVSIDPSPTPAPPMMKVYHPVRPPMPLSVLRTYDKCLLFAANPLLALVPLPESLREEQHTTEQIPVPPMPPVPPNGSLLFGDGVNTDAGVGGSIDFVSPCPSCQWPDVTPGGPLTPDLAVPVNPPCSNEGNYDVKVAPTCPYACDRYVPAIAEVELSNSVLENLEKFIEAETLYQQACELVKSGQDNEALACLKKASDLCPASRYQEMRAELVSKMVCHDIFSGSHEDADTEEQEAPPLECQPYWFGDEDGPSDPASPAPEQSSVTKEHCKAVVLTPTMRVVRIIVLQPEQHQECPPACCMPCEAPCKVPGVDEEVTDLMKACHLALSCGRYAKAAQLAREASALDAKRVAADPIVYKMHILALKMDKGHCCCDDDCCCEPCDDPNCCCHAKTANKPLPPMPSCPVIVMLPPALPPVDPGIVVQLERVYDEAKVKVSHAKLKLEVIEEESEAPEVPKAIAKPFRVQVSPAPAIITYDDLLRFIPGETWTELDLKTKRVRVLWRVRVGDAVYRVRYDGGLSVDLSVLPPMGSAEKCEDPR